MRYLAFLLTFAVVLTAPQPTLALDACRVPVGTDIVTTQLDEFLASLDGLEPLTKDEFETTAQFEGRVAAARANFGSYTFVLETDVDHDQGFYDAYAQMWNFTEYFASNGHWTFEEEALEANGLADAGDYRSVILRSDETETGAYSASNAMGASVSVSSVVATRVGLIELAKEYPRHESGNYNVRFFFLPTLASIYSTFLQRNELVRVVTVSMPIEQARKVKAKLKFAVVGALMEPYLFRHTKHLTPTLDNPRDVTVLQTFLVGDVRCGMVLDDLNRVLAVVQTEPPF